MEVHQSHENFKEIARQNGSAFPWPLSPVQQLAWQMKLFIGTKF
jgi:hypothetical protein